MASVDPVALYNEALTSFSNGLLEEAKAPLNQALMLFEQQDSLSLWVPKCYDLFGTVSYHQGKTQDCIKNHENAKDFFRQQNISVGFHPEVVSNTCHNLSLGFRAHGCHSEALSSIHEAVELRKVFHSNQERRKCVESYSILAEEILYSKKDPNEAMQKIDKGFHFVDPEDKNFECYASLLHARGIICLEKGELPIALEEFGKAVNIYSKCVKHGSVDYAECMAYHGLLLAHHGREEEALECLKKAINMVEAKAPKSIAFATALRIRGDAHVRLSDFYQAQRDYAQVLSIHQEANSCNSSVDKAKAYDGLRLVKDLRRQHQFILRSSSSSGGSLALHQAPREQHPQDDPSWLDTLRDLAGTIGLTFGTFLSRFMSALVVCFFGFCFFLCQALLLRQQGAHRRNPVFLSHTGRCEKSATFTADLSKALSEASIPNFYDEKSLEPGLLFPTEIHDQVQGCNLFVCVWCEEFTECEWCLKELDWALESGCTILPVVLDKTADKPSDDRFAKKIYHKFGEKYSKAVLDRWCENLRVLDKIGFVNNEWTGKTRYIKLRESVTRKIQDTTGKKPTKRSYRDEFRAFGRK